MTEAQFLQAVLDLARTTGWMAHHCRPALNRSGKWSTPIQGNAGFPDLVLAHPKRGVIFAELKSDKGRVTPDQRGWLNTLNLAVLGTIHVTATVWYPENLQHIADLLGAR